MTLYVGSAMTPISDNSNHLYLSEVGEEGPTPTSASKDTQAFLYQVIFGCLPKGVLCSMFIWNEWKGLIHMFMPNLI